jgi:tRNA-dihydrouridine synthase B
MYAKQEIPPSVFTTPTLTIGRHTLPNAVVVAPMAGVTDRPFRMLTKRLGAGYAVSEMAASNPKLWDTVKTSRRLNHEGEAAPIAVQIAGADPAMMAQAAAFNIDKGADIIDINMGCPAKKVCNVACGSALLQHEDLVGKILDAVVAAAAPHNVPVTLKFRTGWDRANKNALNIAMIAQSSGIAALTLHGRTRADLYNGHAEYETIAAVKARVNIPVIANGDIDSCAKALSVLQYTHADAVMIGRAGQGRPWLYGQVARFLADGTVLPEPSIASMRGVLLEHLEDHYAFYGEYQGVRTARKHIQWYTQHTQGFDAFWQRLVLLDDTQAQHDLVADYLDALIDANQGWGGCYEAVVV